MCGIAGFYGFRDDNLIKKFSEQLLHRGPDGEGYFIDEDVTLLNRRLAIIDRKSGDQPIYNEDHSLVVVYNGEIYNYLELRSVLEKKGHKFTTKSDTEVIVHGYEEWGDGCFDKFNGMFAIALYDIKKEELILARDHFGIKPLYYSVMSPSSRVTRFIFSSEIKPIFYSGLIEKKPNDRIIYRYLRYRIHDDNEETFFTGIKRLMPGEMLIVKRSALNIKRYTDLIQELKDATSDQHINKTVTSTDVQSFKEQLIKSIKYRLISEVPVGTCLSGGLDSSTIVSVVNKLLYEKIDEARSVGKTQNTFSAVFSGSTNDEEVYVDKLVESLKPRPKAQTKGLSTFGGDRPMDEKVQCHKIRPTAEEFFIEIEDFIKTQEEPTISTGPYAQYKVMQEARKYVTVLLDGQGADEILAGYLPYYAVYFKQLLKEKRYFKLINELLTAKDVVINYLKKRPSIEPSIYLDEKFKNQYSQEKFTVVSDNLRERLIDDVFFNSLQSLLRYEDRNTMRFSIEGRVPFLDINLIKFIFSFDDEAIINKGWNKYILRQAVKDYLPDMILNRRNKIGFTTPEHEWFMRMKNRIYSIFMSESFIKRKYFNQPEVITGFQKFIEEKTDDTMAFWRMLNLELWLREFFDKKSQKSLKSVKSVKFKKMLEPNTGKKAGIAVKEKTYLRFPIRTELFKKGDNIEKKITQYVYQLINQLIQDKQYKDLLNKPWFVVVSEKIVAVAQGRSYFLYEIKPRFFAKFLSKHVKKTPYGIGLGSPWTMQLAINEKGLPRILLASLVSFITKPFGCHGLFYRITGKEIAAIDGPTEYSLYPSNVSAKLSPKNPEEVVKKIDNCIKRLTPNQNKSDSGQALNVKRFLGTAIIDANDLGQKVLGNSTGLDNKLIERIFSDNPMGQSDEQTPIVIVLEN